MRGYEGGPPTCLSMRGGPFEARTLEMRVVEVGPLHADEVSPFENARG